jgi:hypothetical protein
LAESTGNSDRSSPDFLKKAKDTHKIHVANCRNNDNWTLLQTAKALNRSIGSVSQDLMVVRWWRIHPNRIERFTSIKDCLEWIRDREKDIELEEL